MAGATTMTGKPSCWGGVTCTANTALIHSESGTASLCGWVGISQFRLYSGGQPIQCDVTIGSKAMTTLNLHDAAIRCLETPDCKRFARDTVTGLTTLCSSGRRAPQENREICKPISEMVSRWVYGVLSQCEKHECKAPPCATPMALDAPPGVISRFNTRFHRVRGQGMCSGHQEVLIRGITQSLTEARLLCAAEPHCPFASRGAPRPPRSRP